MTSAYSINLNFNNTIPVKTDFTFKQGDKGITLNLATTGLDPAGTTAHIVFKRSNGTSVEAELTGQTGPSYSYTILGNEFEIPGVVVADLKLYNGDTQRVSTASFIFMVTGDTMDGVGGGTGGYSDQLEQLSQEFEDTLTQYEEAFADVGAVHPAGNYDPTTEYSPLDLVYYSTDNSTYLCVEGCTGETPSPSSQYWQLVVDGSAMSTPNLDDLNDVDASSPSDGDLLGFDGESGDWVPMAPPATGVTSFNGRTGAVTPAVHDYDAGDIDYTNTTSGFAATNSQEAIDEAAANIKALVNVYGSKNLLPNKATTKVTSGITYTVNADGTVTVDGTASANVYLELCTMDFGDTNIVSYEKENVPVNGYILTSDIPNGGDANFRMVYNGTNKIISINVNSGKHVDNVTVKPMIRDARITDKTYVPYVMTNKELTQQVAVSNTFAQLTKQGRLRFLALSNAETNSSGQIKDGNSVFTIDSEHRPANYIVATCVGKDSSNKFLFSWVVVMPDGTINVWSATPGTTTVAALANGSQISTTLFWSV